MDIPLQPSDSCLSDGADFCGAAINATETEKFFNICCCFFKKKQTKKTIRVSGAFWSRFLSRQRVNGWEGGGGSSLHMRFSESLGFFGSVTFQCYSSSVFQLQGSGAS